MNLSLKLKSLLLLGFVLTLTSCSPNSNDGISPSNSTSVETIIPGKTECDNPGDISSDGQYMCAGHGAFYWLLIEDLATFSNEDSNNESSNESNNGYWTTNCVTTEVPNPLYDGTPTDSRGHIQWPTIKTQQCSQVWVQK